jgi:hypothetical protein
MRNYFSLPQFNPGDMRINTAPVQNALEAYGAKTERFGQIERQQQEQTYQRGREAKADTRQDETWKMQNLERLGKSAFAYSQLPPEQRDPQTWGRMVKGMQSFDPSIGTDPDDLDPVSGPAKFAAVYGGQVRDPREDKLMDLKVAQAQKSLAAPVGGEAPSNVREYEYVKSLPPAEQQRYMEVKRAQQMLNAGTQFVDPSGRRAPIPIDNVGKQAQEEIGTAQGKAAAAAPGDISTADSALELLNSIRNDPNREAGTGVSSVQNMIMATPGYDFQNKVDQAKSGAFLTAIQQLRGMGALSNAEGQTATSAVTRMNTATSEGAFMEALNDYERMIMKGRTTAQQRLQAAPNAQPATPVPQGATGAPQPGMIEDGFRFKGGNPSDPNSWERAQ